MMLPPMFSENPASHRMTRTMMINHKAFMLPPSAQAGSTAVPWHADPSCLVTSDVGTACEMKELGGRITTAVLCSAESETNFP